MRWLPAFQTRRPFSAGMALYKGNPWLAIIPYLGIYILFWQFRVSVQALFIFFILLHILNFVIFVPHFFSKIRRSDPRDLFFWTALALILLLPGAYLELPADTWGHIRQIFQWNTINYIHQHDHPHKMSYSLVWTILGKIPLNFHFLSLSVLAMLNQLLVLYQVFRLSEALGLDRRSSQVSAISFMLLFGTNLFGLRYYALSSTPLAYTYYLIGLQALVRFSDTRRRQELFTVIGVIPVIVFNHASELLFLAISGLAIYCWDLFKRKALWDRQKIIFVLFILIVTLFSVSESRYYLEGIHAFLRYVGYPDWHGQSWPEIKDQLSFLKTIDLLRTRSVLETLGVHGLGTLGLVFFFWKRLDRIAFLTIFPLLVLMWPPISIAIVSTRDAHISYRLLYTFPTSYALSAITILLCRKITSVISFRGKKLPAPIVATVILLALALPQAWPWRGRGMFQLSRVHHFHRLRDLDPLLEYFRNKMPNPNGCYLTTDHVASVALWARLSWYYYRTEGGENRHFLFSTPFGDKRRTPQSFWHNIQSKDEFMKALRYWPICEFLLVDTDVLKRFEVPNSEVGGLSGHWAEDYFLQSIPLPDRIYHYVEGLSQYGWTATKVPPFYTLWTGPSLVE